MCWRRSAVRARKFIFTGDIDGIENPGRKSNHDLPTETGRTVQEGGRLLNIQAGCIGLTGSALTVLGLLSAVYCAHRLIG